MNETTNAADLIWRQIEMEPRPERIALVRLAVTQLLERLAYDIAKDPAEGVATSVFLLASDIDERLEYINEQVKKAQ